MVYGTYNYSYWGESKPTYKWGGHIVSIVGLCWIHIYIYHKHP